jgi:hypothetical protein
MLRTQGWFCEVAAEALQSSFGGPPSTRATLRWNLEPAGKGGEPNNCTLYRFLAAGVGNIFPLDLFMLGVANRLLCDPAGG